jgi:hypothetical protein
MLRVLILSSCNTRQTVKAYESKWEPTYMRTRRTCAYTHMQQRVLFSSSFLPRVSHVPLARYRAGALAVQQRGQETSTLDTRCRHTHVVRQVLGHSTACSDDRKQSNAVAASP